jgi:DNA-binding LacI/PurR family transcriptional regulator
LSFEDLPVTLVDVARAAAVSRALGVLSAARDAGRSVGDDLLVASCVDSLAMQLVTPAVTAIDLRPREIGYDSANVLLRLIEGEELPRLARRARPHLELRQSTSRSVAAPSFV